MKKRKTMLACSLLFAGLVTTGLTGCSPEDLPLEDVDTYSIKLSYDETMGVVTADKKSGFVIDGETVTVSVHANSGYKVTGVSINGESQDPNSGSYTFTPNVGVNEVIVNFEKDVKEDEDDDDVIKTFKIVTESDAYGFVSTDRNSGNVGETVNINYVPNNGYELAKVFINDIEQPLYINNFKPVEGLNTIRAEFKEVEVNTEETFTIKTETDGKGKITVEKEEGYVGETVPFRVYPKAGYHVSSILINGVSVGTDTYSFKPIGGENIISVFFSNGSQEGVVVEEVTTYIIQTADDGNGEVYVDKTRGDVGDTVNITVDPHEGFILEKIVINGMDSGKITSFQPGPGLTRVDAIFKSEYTPDPTVRTFNVEATSGENGTVELSATEGIIGTSVFIYPKPDKGYQVAKIVVNGINFPTYQRNFEPKEGLNTVEVYFEPEEMDEDFSVKITKVGEGDVFIDKTKGKAGETVNLTIEPDEEFEIYSIKINGELVDNSTRSFETIPGLNEIYVEFIVKDFEEHEFTGITPVGESDIRTSEEAAEIIASAFDIYLEDNENITVDEFKTWLVNADIYNNFVLKYGYTLESLEAGLNYIVNDGLYDLMFAPTNVVSYDNLKSLANYIYDGVSKFSLEEFAGYTGLFTFIGVINGFNDLDLDNLYNLALQNSLDIAQESRLDVDAKNYVNELIYNSTFNLETSFAEYLVYSDVVSELIYRPFNSIAGSYTKEQISEVLAKGIEFVKSLSGEETDLKITDQFYMEIANLVSRIFDKNSFSKESFAKIGETLANAKDPFESIMNVLPYAENNRYFGALKDAAVLLKDNSERAYYFFKTIGRFATKLQPKDISKIELALIEPNTTQETKYAKVFVYVSRVIADAIDELSLQGDDVRHILALSGDFVTKLKEIILSGNTNGVIEANTIDIKLLIDNIYSAYTTNPEKLTESQVASYSQAYTRFINMFRPIAKEDAVYNIDFDKYYKVGEALKLTITDKDGNDVTSEAKVENFDTSKLGYRKVRIVLPDDSIIYYSYFVSKSGEYIEIDTQYFYLNDDPDLTFNVLVHNSDNPAGSYKKFSDYEHGTIDTSKDGTFASWVKNAEGDYYFFAYIVE